MRIGGVFSADSQFTLASGASRVAIACLVRRMAESGGVVVDVQHDGDHARLLGAVPIPRAEYLDLLREHGSSSTALPADALPTRELAA